MSYLIFIQAETSIQDMRQQPICEHVHLLLVSKGDLDQILDILSNLSLDPLYADLTQEIYQVVSIKLLLNIPINLCLI